ncbi:hypothetical protein SRHO_G00323010 [Serrasalmus rhombeus]
MVSLKIESGRSSTNPSASALASWLDLFTGSKTEPPWEVNSGPLEPPADLQLHLQVMHCHFSLQSGLWIVLLVDQQDCTYDRKRWRESLR